MITDKERHERAKNFRDMISARNYGIPGALGSFVDIDDVLSVVFVMRKALKTEGDEAWGYGKPFVVVVLTAFGLVALVIFGRFAVDAVMHLAVPQVAMINDMLEMVQQ